MPVSRELLLAGDTVFTIEVPPGTVKGNGQPALPCYTYRVEYVPESDQWPAAWFVHVLAGDNFVYLGKLSDYTGQVSPTKASRWPLTSFRYRLLNRVLARLWSGDVATIEAAGYAVFEGLPWVDEPFLADMVASWPY